MSIITSPFLPSPPMLDRDILLWTKQITNELVIKFTNLMTEYNLLSQVIVPDTDSGITFSSRDLTGIKSITTDILKVVNTGVTGAFATDVSGNKTVVVTFPIAFAVGETPIVLVSITDLTDAVAQLSSVRAESRTNTQFTAACNVVVVGGAGSSARFVWLALKP